jgi:hypothetical protein
MASFCVLSCVAESLFAKELEDGRQENGGHGGNRHWRALEVLGKTLRVQVIFFVLLFHISQTGIYHTSEACQLPRQLEVEVAGSWGPWWSVRSVDVVFLIDIVAQLFIGSGDGGVAKARFE